MTRKFKTADYEATLNLTVSLRECLPENHLARFIVEAIRQFDLSDFYARYGERGGEAFAPEILLGLLFYGYATGVFSSRKIERATHESLPFRFIAGNLRPDHDTLAHFRKAFLPEIQALFVQVLLLAQAAGVLKLGNISLDATKIHADASKSHAVSYQRLLELEDRLRAEVAELLTLSEQADRGDLPAGLDFATEITFRQERLVNLAQAKAVLEARAQERYAADQAEYEAKVREREDRARQTRQKPRDPFDVLMKVGGLEIAGLVGVILGAAAGRVPVVVDGFISGAAALIAAGLAPRGPRRRPPYPSAQRLCVRRQRGRRPALHRHRICGGQVAPRSAPRRPARNHRHRPPDLRRARPRPPERHYSSRLEAGVVSL